VSEVLIFVLLLKLINYKIFSRRFNLSYVLKRYRLHWNVVWGAWQDELHRLCVHARKSAWWRFPNTVSIELCPYPRMFPLSLLSVNFARKQRRTHGHLSFFCAHGYYRNNVYMHLCFFLFLLTPWFHVCDSWCSNENLILPATFRGAWRHVCPSQCWSLMDFGKSGLPRIADGTRAGLPWERGPGCGDWYYNNVLSSQAQCIYPGEFHAEEMTFF
jgi:hypothetical protein